MDGNTDKNHNDRAAPTERAGVELSTGELLGWAEFACWTMLALAPFLYYVNGPSVSTDQLVVRTALVILSATGAVILRIINWRRARRRQRADQRHD